MHDENAVSTAVEEVNRLNRIGDFIHILAGSGFPDASEAVPGKKVPVLALDDLFSSIRFWGYQADRWSA